jgi:hypothetical protein
MAIIGTLPNNIQDGQAVDASPVMADFNFIVTQVNANANPTGTLTAPSGTTTVFYQAAAPAGWTTNSGFTDHTLWISAANGGTQGGATAYSNMFSNAWTSGGHALTTAELAVHNHGVTDPQHLHVVAAGSALVSLATGGVQFDVISGSQNTASASTGISIQNAGSGNAHSHVTQFNAQYAAMIMATKS